MQHEELPQKASSSPIVPNQPAETPNQPTEQSKHSDFKPNQIPTEQTNPKTAENVHPSKTPLDSKNVEQLPLEQSTEKFNPGVDHFLDWPSPSYKPNCLRSDQYVFTDKTVSAVIYMKDELDSLPTQTFLSILQFTAESGITVNKIVLAYINNKASILSHEANADHITSLAGDRVVVESVSAATEWLVKRKALERISSEQVGTSSATQYWIITVKWCFTYSLKSLPQHVFKNYLVTFFSSPE